MDTVRLLLSPAEGSLPGPDASSRRLPRLPISARVRCAVAAQRWLDQQRIKGHVIVTIGGVGRRDGSVDWGVWIATKYAPHGFHELTLTSIKQHCGDSVDLRIVHELERVLRQRDTPEWFCFDERWPDRVTGWIEGSYGQCGDLFVVKADPTAVVAKCRTGCGFAYFTTRRRRFVDPEVSGVLRSCVSGTAPATLAHDGDRGWWLAEG